MANKPYYPPDARLNAPELFYPKRKPVSKVKIDWSHPLTKGLVHHIPFIGKEIDIVGKPNDGITSVSTGRSGLRHKLTGEQYIQLALPGNSLMDNQTFTASMVVSFSNLEAGYIFNASIRVGIVINKEGVSGVGAYFYDGAAFINVQTPIDSLSIGDLYILTVVKSPTDLRFNISNNAPLTLATTNDILYSSSNRYSTIGASVNNGTSNFSALNFEVYDYKYYDRALSNAEIKSLHNNPYQFLILDRG